MLVRGLSEREDGKMDVVKGRDRWSLLMSGPVCTLPVSFGSLVTVIFT